VNPRFTDAFRPIFHFHRYCPDLGNEGGAEVSDDGGEREEEMFRRLIAPKWSELGEATLYEIG